MKRTALRRNPEQTRLWQRRTRRPLPSRSRRRVASTANMARVRAEVFNRDGGCLLEGEGPPCYGGLTYHHRRKAGAGGAYTVDNGVTLCARHNLWIEDEPPLFVDNGKYAYLSLVVRQGDQEWELLGERTNR